MIAGAVIPFVALMPGVARTRDMHEGVIDPPIPPISTRYDVLIITNPVDDVPRWADEIGAKVSWAETVDGIEMGIEKILDAVERRRAIETLRKALNRWATGNVAKVSLTETIDGINIKIVK